MIVHQPHFLSGVDARCRRPPSVLVKYPPRFIFADDWGLCVSFKFIFAAVADPMFLVSFWFSGRRWLRPKPRHVTESRRFHARLQSSMLWRTAMLCVMHLLAPALTSWITSSLIIVLRWETFANILQLICSASRRVPPVPLHPRELRVPPYM